METFLSEYGKAIIAAIVALGVIALVFATPVYTNADGTKSNLIERIGNAVEEKDTVGSNDATRKRMNVSYPALQISTKTVIADSNTNRYTLSADITNSGLITVKDTKNLVKNLSEAKYLVANVYKLDDSNEIGESVSQVNGAYVLTPGVYQMDTSVTLTNYDNTGSNFNAVYSLYLRVNSGNASIPDDAGVVTDITSILHFNGAPNFTDTVLLPADYSNNMYEFNTSKYIHSDNKYALTNLPAISIDFNNLSVDSLRSLIGQGFGVKCGDQTYNFVFGTETKYVDKGSVHTIVINVETIYTSIANSDLDANEKNIQIRNYFAGGFAHLIERYGSEGRPNFYLEDGINYKWDTTGHFWIYTERDPLTFIPTVDSSVLQ